MWATESVVGSWMSYLSTDSVAVASETEDDLLIASQSRRRVVGLCGDCEGRSYETDPNSLGDSTVSDNPALDRSPGLLVRPLCSRR